MRESLTNSGGLPSSESSTRLESLLVYKFIEISASHRWRLLSIFSTKNMTSQKDKESFPPGLSGALNTLGVKCEKNARKMRAKT